jgi:hypothetical protein
MTLTYNAIGLLGGSVGTAHLREDKIEWRDRANVSGGEFAKGNIKGMRWEMIGSKGYLKVYMNDGSFTSMDGFAQTDYEKIKEFVTNKYGLELSREQVCFACVLPSILDFTTLLVLFCCYCRLTDVLFSSISLYSDNRLSHITELWRGNELR